MGVNEEYQNAIDRYNEAIDNVIKSSDNWFSFLTVMGNCFGLPHEAQLAVWQRNNSEVGAMADSSWQKMNYIFNDNDALVIAEENEIKKYHLISEVTQTENSKPIPIWYTDSDDYYDIKNEIYKKFHIRYQKYDKDITQTIRDYSKSIKFSNESLSKIFHNSLEDSLLHRLGKHTSLSTGYEYNFAGISRNDTITLIKELNTAANKFLSIVRSVSKKNKKYVNYTFASVNERDYNIIENNSKEVTDNDTRTGNSESVRSDIRQDHIQRFGLDGDAVRRGVRPLSPPGGRRLSHSSSESDTVRGGRDSGSLREAAMGKSEVERSGGTDQTVHGRTSDRKSSEELSKENRKRNAGQGASVMETDNGPARHYRITGQRLLEICSGIRNGTQTSERNSDESTPLLQLNLFNNENTTKTAELDENDPAVFLYRNLEKALLSGTGIVDGKFRVFEYFTADHNKSSRAVFLKDEYGIGGQTFVFTNNTEGDIWHDAKGYSITDSNKTTTQISWSEITAIIETLIDSGIYLSDDEKKHYPIYLDEKKERKIRSDFLHEIDNLFRDEKHNLKKLSTDIQTQRRNTFEYQQAFIDGDNSIDTLKSIYDLLTVCSQSELNNNGAADELLDQFKKFAPELFTKNKIDEYFKLQEEKQDNIVLVKNGDFFEIMGDKAQSVADTLDLVLTMRDKNSSKIPLCGFPDSRAEEYTDKLLQNNYTIVLAEYDDYNNIKVTDTIIPSEETVTVSEDIILQTGDEIIEEAENLSEKRILTINDFVVDIPSKQRLNTNTHRNYKALLEISPILLNKNISYIRMSAGDGYMPLIIEKIGSNMISVAHYYEQHGDLMRDPEIEFILDSDKEELRPRSYVQDNIGAYQYLERDDGTVDPIAEAQLSKFTVKWFNNIKWQDYKTEKILFDYKGDDISLNFGENGNVINIDSNSAEEFINDFNVALDDNITLSEKQNIKPENDIPQFNNIPNTDTIRSIKTSNNKQDKFYINPDKESVTWIYLNPDSDAGSQYVENIVTFEQINNAAKTYSKPDDFFENLETQAKQSLGDSGTSEFAELDEIYLSELHDQEGLTENVMNALIEASKFKEQAKINYHITNDNIGTETKSERFTANIKAIKTLKQIERENRFATPDEQEVLSKYVGWGGLSEVFDDRHSHYNELHSLLNEQEYDAARSSTLTAFYTPPTVIKSIYSALENMGFEKGSILEPSCGVGNFFGLIPDSLSSNVKLNGVEIDSISGRIAKQLYQKADIQIKGFEETEYANDTFDAVIGNVPFGQFKVVDKDYDKHNFLIHDFFFAKALDKVKPGGIIAFITSKGTMDKSNPSVRKYIAKRAELLGAVRLPDNTFKRVAGTEVTSDIIFLQKRDRVLDIEPEWIYLSQDDNAITLNSYFVDHPEMILGNMQMVSTAYGFDSTCKDNGKDLSEQLTQAVENIKGTIKIQENIASDIKAEESVTEKIPAIDGVKDGAYAIIDNHLFKRDGNEMKQIKVANKQFEKYQALIRLRDICQNLINIQADGASDEEVLTEQERMNNAYDEFVSKYCRISDKSVYRMFQSDPAHSLLCSLEKYDSDGNFKRKSDMFYKRTIRPNRVITSAKSSDDALMASLSIKGNIDMPYMMQLTGFSQDKIENDLTNIIFRTPNFDNTEEIKWVTADEYLSGNVRNKLEFAKIYSKFKNESWIHNNISALEKVQPAPLTAAQITVRLGATWIPNDIINDFMFQLLKTNHTNYVNAQYSEITGSWTIENKNWDSRSVYATTTYGTSRIDAYSLLENALNLKDTVIRDSVYEDGKTKYVVNEKETRLAQGKQKQIQQAFDNWVFSDPNRRKQIEDIYNKKFNSCVQRKYDGSHLFFDGMNCNVTLRPHQKDAVARCLYGGNTLLAHTVGAGKTYEMCATAMEAKRIGLCHKSMIVVPNNIVAQFGKEFMELYPNANILVTTEKDFTKENRKKFCSRIATNDYDAVIIGQSQFEKIPLNKDTKIRMMNDQLEEIIRGISEAKKEGNNHITVKALETTRKSLENNLKKLNEIEQDDVVTFEQLGVDKLFVDEAHNYKNLFLYTKMSNVAGINTTQAKKSSDLFDKVRWLDEKTNSKGTVFATGTPVSNTMAELYTMQRYLQYDRLKELGLIHFDAWASTFGQTTMELELKPEGTGFRMKKRFSKFYNIPELMNVFREVADIQTKDMLNLPLPKVEFVNKVCPPSEIQKEIVKTFAARADNIRDGKVRLDEDNMLLITSEGRKLALDQRLIDNSLPDYENSKVNECVEDVYSMYSNTSEQKLTQLIFCDLSTPNAKGFNVYDDIKNKLIAKGIPENEIAFAHDAKNNTQKEKLNQKVRNGKIRILIGSTQKLGTGTNVQDRLIATYDLDCPWRPSDLEQRLGRIERQGNINKNVKCYRYVTEGTFDAYMYQLVEKKQHFINQIWHGDTSIREIEDMDESSLNYAKLKALATGNPLIQEKMELDIQIKDLLLQQQNHNAQIYALQDQIAFEYPKRISNSKARIHSLERELEIVNSHADEQYITVDSKAISEPKEIGILINSYKEAFECNPSLEKRIGTFKGLPITLSYDDFMKRIDVRVGNNSLVNMGIDAKTNGNKVLEILDNFSEKIDVEKDVLSTLTNDLKNAQTAVTREFPMKDELEVKQARLDELNELFEKEQSIGLKQNIKNQEMVR